MIIVALNLKKCVIIFSLYTFFIIQFVQPLDVIKWIQTSTFFSVLLVYSFQDKLSPPGRSCMTPLFRLILLFWVPHRKCLHSLPHFFFLIPSIVAAHLFILPERSVLICSACLLTIPVFPHHLVVFFVFAVVAWKGVVTGLSLKGTVSEYRLCVFFCEMTNVIISVFI